MSDVSKCRTCGAQIIWARSASGKQIPLSAASEERRFVMVEDQEEITVASTMTYISHFADCPDADEWRK